MLPEQRRIQNFSDERAPISREGRQPYKLFELSENPVKNFENWSVGVVPPSRSATENDKNLRV